MANPEDILTYWLDELGPAGWYRGDEALDQEIRDHFQSTWADTVAGKNNAWLANPNGVLAYLILMDQFPRNMFRGQALSFSTDGKAIAAAKSAISKCWDMQINEPQRQFFYLPLMHSENLCDQDRCVRLMLTRMPETGGSNLLHAKAHRQVIRQFGRFPYRNDALMRTTTETETAYIDDGGYGTTVEALKTPVAA